MPECFHTARRNAQVNFSNFSRMKRQGHFAAVYDKLQAVKLGVTGAESWLDKMKAARSLVCTMQGRVAMEPEIFARITSRRVPDM